ncbi:AraC family transcriptional regulator [Lampropedia puyangensis]|uniref:AraC family transcriptional regulator n=1 Tax=Lampropedia puyangensis TaxID=1330072 RepID=A0A4S8EV94_9BURK|nr:AraC family transcriptional regulator [Lampropedia puyangensis]THT98789.1 AraC family transcriptional regulator [Lampropedia puyangensis]
MHDLDTPSHHLVNWLLGGLQLDTTVFHVGQYCGSWRGSTAGRLVGSFHLVLHGQCLLHSQAQESVLLGPQDGVLFLRDVPHCLSSQDHSSAGCNEQDAAVGVKASTMLPLDSSVSGSTGLACGFFHFKGAVSQLLLAGLPDAVVIRAQDPSMQAIAPLFSMIRAEAGSDPEHSTPLMQRLVDLLFFYVLRHHITHDSAVHGLWALARATDLQPLLSAMLAAPGDVWSTESMARFAHMSRTTFYRRFVETTGQAPAAFLQLLRVKIAAQRLERGESVERAADYVGYSYAAFHRAFKKVTGAAPGSWRRNGALQ